MGAVRRRDTRLGLAPPSRPEPRPRPDGRYSIIAPDAPVGSVLRVTAADGSLSLVQVVCPHGTRRLFVDADATEVEFRECDWEFATRMECEAFWLKGRIGRYADMADIHGAMSFAATVRALPRVKRDQIVRGVADELRARGKGGRASQVLSYRFDEEW